MNYDVAVVGGGLVGMTLACALGRAGMSVAVIEARAAPAQPGREGFDVRVSALSPASQRILLALGAWQRMARERVQPFEHIRVWDRAGRGEIHFDAADAGVARLGYIIENREILWALEQTAGSLDGVRVYRPAKVERLEAGPGAAVLDLDGARVQATLVAGADGARSRVRELAGIEFEVRPYHQEAVVATVRTAEPRGDTAWQRFLPNGPLALLPLPEGWTSIVWSAHPGEAQGLVEMSDGDFAAALSAASEHRLGAVEAVAGRARFPLARVQARRYLAPRVALVGDAAHTIHPLAGQGVNLGLLDAAALTDVLEGLRCAGRDLGLLGNLRRYERWRLGHNALTGDAMSGFHWLFGARWAPVAFVRNLGFALTDRVTPAKRLFMRYACGLVGDLPRLARDAGSGSAGGL